MSYPKILLKPEKEQIFKENYHHWIFSGAILKWPDSFENGEIFQVLSSDEKVFLGYGYFNKNQSLCGRMVCFSKKDPLQAISESMMSSFKLREMLFDSKTTGYRVVHGEADELPGLVIDRYADTYVVQISTLGMERLKPYLVSIIKDQWKAKNIIEKSDSSSRRVEGLEDKREVLFGEDLEKISFLENEIVYLAYPKKGQKTGFFLDQRKLRILIKQISSQKKVLNCFSYTGGFSLAALKGGAKEVVSVDSSAQALKWMQDSFQINGLTVPNQHLVCEDVFSFLETNKHKWDLVIVDPPAFAKKYQDVKNALKAYEQLNALALRATVDGGIFISCSCSYFISKQIWFDALLKAAKKQKVKLTLLEESFLSSDHPLNTFHKETQYLKSAVFALKKLL